VICHDYDSFNKDTIEELAKYFENIYVLVRYNPLAKLSKFYPFLFLNRFSLKNKVDYRNKPKNVKIFITPFLYLTINFLYRQIGKKHYNAVQKIINKNSFHFDMILSQFAFSSGFVGAKLKEKYNVPLIIQGLGYDIYDLPFRDKKWKKIIEDSLNKADLILTVSQSCLNALNQLKINTRIELIPNSYNDQLFFPMNTIEARRHLNLPLDKKILINVGNIIKIKGQLLLVEALSELIKVRNDILVIIIGDGSLKKKIEKKIDKLNLSSHLMLVGRINHAEVPFWLNSSDIFVFPSIRESFGVAQIEALACGVPVVATINGGSEDIIKDHKIGRLLKSRDPQILSNLILVMLDYPFNRDIIANYAKMNYSKKYVINQIKKNMDSLL